MDVVDAFVVSLGLDPSQYNREMKKYRDDRKRMAEEDGKYNRQSEDAQKRAVEGFRAVRNEVAGFLLMLGGANSLTGFVKDILTGAAATGRFAANIGMATERVSVWENLLTRVGGKASDARNVLGTLATAFQNLQLTGTTGHDADFQGLGVNAKDLQNPETALLKIADASGRMGRSEFTARASRLGIDPATITLLAKGRVEVTRLMEEQQKLGVTTDKDARAAQELEARMAALESGIRQKALPIISKLADRFATWLGDQDNLNGVLSTTETIFKGMGIVAGGVVTVFEQLSKAIREISGAYNGLPKGVRDKFENIGSMLSGGDYKNAWDYLGEAIGGEGGATMKRRWGSEGKGDHAAAGSGGGALATGSGNRSAATVEQFFRARGYTAAQARGITAAVVAEGGLNKRTGGGYKGRALGIGQLLGGRRAEFLKKYGPNFTFQQELEFMDHELKGGDPGGAAVRMSKTERAAMQAMVTKFYRPAAGAETMGDLNRGSAWLAGGRPGASVSAPRGGSTSTTTQTTSVGQVVVYTAATDADGIAHDMRGALAKRGLVVQANTGLQP